MFRPPTAPRRPVVVNLRRQGLLWLEEYLAELEHNGQSALRVAEELALPVCQPVIRTHLRELMFLQAEVAAELDRRPAPPESET